MTEPLAEGVRASPGRFEQFATRVAFLVVGFSVASWAPLIPFARVRVGVNEGQLGGLLLCLGIGAVATMLFSAGVAARFGCRKVILIAGLVGCASLPVMASASTVALLAASLFTFGASIGMMDLVMNIQAIIVERASGRAMMSGFHGMFSVGGIAGAGAMTGLLSIRLAPLTAVFGVVGLSLAMLFGCAKGLLPYGSEKDSPSFAWPKGPVLLIGALCFVMFLAEGSVLDWSGVLLNVSRGMDKGQAGLGYVAFAVTMTIGRLSGDAIVQRFGARPVLVFGGLSTAVGFSLAALVPSWAVSIFGFTLVGIGAANVVPVLFSAAGRQTSMPTNLAVAAVTSVGYAGILAGPALIGFLAHATSLPLALLAVGVLTLSVPLVSGRGRVV